ncbi:FUSC family protein [Rhodococcus sp. D2-41]|nr:FUSC family protein [Rhodococcus sp. D2-41]
MHLPAPAPPRAVLFGFPPVGKRWPGAVRAALALGIPASIVAALGYHQQALTVAIGAFAVLYGEGKAYRARWKVVTIAAVALAGSAWFGALVGRPVHRAIAEGHTHFLLLWVVVAMTTVGLAAAYAADALRLGPPGGFFFILATEIGSLIAGSGMPPAEIAGWGAVGGASSLIVSMSGLLRDPRAPERAAVAAAGSAVDAYATADRSSATAPRARHLASLKLQAAWHCLDDGGLLDGSRERRRHRSDHPLVGQLGATQVRLSAALSADPTVDPDSDLDDIRPLVPMPRPGIRYRLVRSLHPNSHAWTAALRLLVACLIAGTVAVAIGSKRPDWAVIAAALVLHQGPDRIMGTYRGVHRIVGTALGLLLFAALYELDPTGLWLILLLAALQFMVEMLVARNYGIAVVFITPLALLMGGSATLAASPASAMGERLVETAVGVCVALAVLWTVDRRSHRRILRWVDGRVAQLIAATARRLDGAPAGAPAVLELRRDLEFELAGSAMAGVDAAHNDPAWTAPRWPAHSELHHLGYDVLGGLWALPPDGRPDTATTAQWSRRLNALAEARARM